MASLLETVVSLPGVATRCPQPAVIAPTPPALTRTLATGAGAGGTAP